MFYQLDGTGKVTGRFAVAQDSTQPAWSGFTQVQLADTDPKVIAFLAAANAVPDPNGFTQAVKNGMGGIVAANALAVAYPLFFSAVQSGIWADVQALVIDAKTKAVITTAQYNAIKAAAATFNIPVTL